MSATSQVESFCESCGTRYAFEPPRSAKRHLVKVGRLVGILPDEPDVDDSALVVSKDPFHGAFHFCLECRRFTCPTCWDAPAGFCRACASVLAGHDEPSMPDYTLDAETQALLRAAFGDLAQMGAGEGWASLEPPPEARPTPVAIAPEMGEAPEDDLSQIIEAGAAARVAREAQAAREAAEAEEREQARLEDERRQQAEAARLAAEQAEAQRVAWEEYERQRLQYEADLAAWEAAEAQRVADEEVQRIAAAAAVSAAARQEAMERAAAAEAQAASERTQAEQAAAGAAQTELAVGRPGDPVSATAEADHAGRPTREADAPTSQRAEATHSAPEPEPRPAEPQTPDDPVWETLAGALGPDVAAEEPVVPAAPERPQIPPVPLVPPPSPDGPWQMGAPPAGMPGWAAPSVAGFRPAPSAYRPSPPGFAAGGHPMGVNGNRPVDHGQLRTGIRPCPRCDLALSANARFCRRCGLPQG